MRGKKADNKSISAGGKSISKSALITQLPMNGSALSTLSRKH
jgi:hypothetical protein